MVRQDQRDDARERRITSEAGSREDDRILSGRGTGETFAELLSRRFSRRGFLRGGVAAGAAGAMVLSAPALDKLGNGVSKLEPFSPTSALASPVAPMPGLIRFQGISPQPLDAQEVVVAPGHRVAVLLSWGDPIRPGVAEWDVDNQSAAAQNEQFGYNCDYIGWHSLPWGSWSSSHGLLWVNHEYTNPEIMFPGYDPENPTQQQVDVEIAAHGGAIVELRRVADGSMQVVFDSPYNRRVTGTTPIEISGPAAGHDWMTTSTDPSGRNVLGTLNNCAGGITPWGTVLTCEENFHQYFGNLADLPANDPRFAVHRRYGVPEEASERKWEWYHERFDVGKEPNEPFRFGWVVEVNPYEPGSTPVKRTALGRFRHEGATFGFSPSGRVIFYSGDDARFEYVYKYVSDNAYDPSRPGVDQGLLDEGVLYVARFNDDGSGEWLPLVYGQGPLTEEHGFTSQGDVLIKTRIAADLLGATKMDRPEDIQQNPINRKIYGAMTNNTRRSAENVDAANPRPENRWGHVIEWAEAGNDAAATTFTWELFILCGDPEDPSTYFAGFPKELVSPIAAPDNVNFDLDGNLWISTDGQPSALELADALIAVPTEGPDRGNTRQFLSVVYGSECASFEFTRDNRNLFVSVQHPGEGGTFEEPLTLWPNTGEAARPSVIQVWAEDGGRVGGGARTPITNVHFYRTWARTDLPVAEGWVRRTWMWGPEANSIEMTEPYRDAPGGWRTVQYFDKSRMEINEDGDPSSTWYVTNGLLARELITGQRQEGDAIFMQQQPAQLNVAGDPDDPNGPIYATFNGLMGRDPLPVGSTITQTVDRAGAVGNDEGLARHGVTAAHYVAETGHVVASVFWDFMNSSGLVHQNGNEVQDRLFEDPFYATGLPITEAFWTTVRVAGVERRVLVQVFERRVLTYTPDNPDGWQVEAGNVGRHYYAWRYGGL